MVNDIAFTESDRAVLCLMVNNLHYDTGIAVTLSTVIFLPVTFLVDVVETTAETGATLTSPRTVARLLCKLACQANLY